MSAPADDDAGRRARRPVRGRWMNFGILLSILNSIGTLWIFALMIVINIDVFGRTLFSVPVRGTAEFVSFSIIGIIFFQLAHALRANRLIRSDGLLGYLRRRWPRIGFGFQGLFSVAGAILFAILFYASYPLFIYSWVNSEFVGAEGYVTFPIWPIRLIILIGSACAFVQFLIFAWHDFIVVAGMKRPVDLEPAGPSVIT